MYERKRKCRQRRVKASAVGLAFALGIQRVINNKFAFENFVISQSECSEAAGDPAQTFSSWVRIRRMRISRAYNLAQQSEGRISELVFFHHRIERNIVTMVPELAVRHVEYDSITDLRPIGASRQENKLRVSVDEFSDEPWAGNSIHFNFLASDPFHELDLFRGSLVLVCGRCCCALRRSPNLYSSCGRAHRRGARRFCCRSQCRIVDSYLSCISLAQQRLESEIQRGRVQLFTSHGNLCWCWHDRVLSSFSKGRAAVGCAGYFSRRRGHHGHRWHLVFPRSTIVAENRRRCVRDHWFVFAAQIEIHSVFISSA